MSQQIVSSYESILVPVPNGDQIHVAYLPSENNIATVLLLPGMANNSSIFREKDGFLALQALLSMRQWQSPSVGWPSLSVLGFLLLE